MTREPSKALELARAGLLAFCMAAGCGSRDEPRGSSPEPEPEGSGSRIWEVLTDPESIDALCRIVGVSAVGTAMVDCDETVARCRDAAAALETLGGFGAGAAADVDLEPLLGCPVSASQLDLCLAQALERGIELYGDGVTCATTAMPDVDVASLALVPGCIGVALRCPELLGGMF